MGCKAPIRIFTISFGGFKPGITTLPHGDLAIKTQQALLLNSLTAFERRALGLLLLQLKFNKPVSPLPLSNLKFSHSAYLSIYTYLCMCNVYFYMGQLTYRLKDVYT